MYTLNVIEAERIQVLSRFMLRVETNLNLAKRKESVPGKSLAEITIKIGSDTFNQIIMENSITVQALAAQVRTMRNNQNKYFRIPKENKEERQVVLRASKASESNVDKLISIVLD